MYFHNHEYIFEEFPSTIPNFLKEKVGATGVYLSVLDFPTQPIDEDVDEEFAHLNTKVVKKLQYIGANDDHKFMLSEEIATSSLTYKLFEKADDGTLKEYVL